MVLKQTDVSEAVEVRDSWVGKVFSLLRDCARLLSAAPVWLCCAVQDPQMAIPKGTLLAILITGIVYLGVAVSTGGPPPPPAPLPVSVWLRSSQSHRCNARLRHQGRAS